MANGRYVHAGAVAADPRYLRMNSKIKLASGRTLTVEDTGGDIKGRRLDIWMASCKDAINWGVRPIRIYVPYK